MSTLLRRLNASKNVLRLATNRIKNTANNPIKITQKPLLRNSKINNQKVENIKIQSNRNKIPKNKLCVSIPNKPSLYTTKGKSTTHFKKIVAASIRLERSRSGRKNSYDKSGKTNSNNSKDLNINKNCTTEGNENINKMNYNEHKENIYTSNISSNYMTNNYLKSSNLNNINHTNYSNSTFSLYSQKVNQIIGHTTNNKISSLPINNIAIQNKEHSNDISNNTYIKENPSFTRRTISEIKDQILLTKKECETFQSKILNQSNYLYSEQSSNYCNQNVSFGVTNLQENINNINFESSNFKEKSENLYTTKAQEFSKEEYKQLLNTYTMIEYGDSILKDLLENEEINNNFLEKHSFGNEIRIKMVDWMIEVFYHMRSMDNTFFLAVNIMDRYFKKTNLILKPENIHLIGMTCIFISSKYCEVYPIKIKTLVENIGHFKFTKEEIFKKENEILKDLNYEITKPNLYDFLNYYFQDLLFFFENNFNIKNQILSKEYLQKFIESRNIKISLDSFFYDRCTAASKYTNNMRMFLNCVLIYLGKMCCHEYSIISYKPSFLAASIFLVGLKICEDVNHENYINDLILSKLVNLCNQNKDSLFQLSSLILQYAQNFENVAPGIHNLYKTHFQTLKQITFTK